MMVHKHELHLLKVHCAERLEREADDDGEASPKAPMTPFIRRFAAFFTQKLTICW
jgi:hypothetical protein